MYENVHFLPTNLPSRLIRFNVYPLAGVLGATAGLALIRRATLSPLKSFFLAFFELVQISSDVSHVSNSCAMIRESTRGLTDL